LILLANMSSTNLPVCPDVFDVFDVFDDLSHDSSAVPVCRDFFTVDKEFLAAVDDAWKKWPHYFGEAVALQNWVVELYRKRMRAFVDGTLTRTFSTRYCWNGVKVIDFRKPSKFKQVVFTPTTDYVLLSLRHILRVNRLPLATHYFIHCVFRWPP